MADDDDIHYMPIEQFCEEGYLQEANRLFFHAHGLALAVIEFAHEESPESLLTDFVKERLRTTDELRSAFMDLAEGFIDLLRERRWLPPAGTRDILSGVWDYREDPEGVMFGADFAHKPEAWEKMWAVEKEFDSHVPERQKIIGQQIREHLEALGVEAEVEDERVPPWQPVFKPDVQLEDD